MSGVILDYSRTSAPGISRAVRYHGPATMSSLRLGHGKGRSGHALSCGNKQSLRQPHSFP